MQSWNWLLVLGLSLGLQAGVATADPVIKPAKDADRTADAKGGGDVLPGYLEVKVASLRAILPDLQDKKITFVACYDSASTDIYGPVNDSGFKNGRDYNLGFHLAVHDRVNGNSGYASINGYARHTKEMTDQLAGFDVGQWMRVYGTVRKSRPSRYYHETACFIEIELLKPVADPTGGTGVMTRPPGGAATPPVGGPPVGGPTKSPKSAD